MLRGDEHFYGDWLRLVRSAVKMPPVVDLGTSSPFQKEMAAIREYTPEPYWCFDVVPSPDLDGMADAHRLPFRDGSIGTVLCSHVLEHVTDPARVVRELRRVVKPGGSAYLTFPDAWPYHARPGVYADYHRFKHDAIGLLLEGWSEVKVLKGGGVGQVGVQYVAPRWQPIAQKVANFVDRHGTTTLTPVFYVVATR